MSLSSISPGLPGTPAFHRPSVTDDQARLRKTATQLEGLFVQRMFSAMRDSVPEDSGAMPTSSAESTFTQMLDEKMSERVPAQWSGAHSLASALYNQLRKQLPGAPTDAASPMSTPAASPAAGATTTPGMTSTPR